MSKAVFAPVSYGELIDKITILELKAKFITDHAKHINVMRELDQLTRLWESLGFDEDKISEALAGLRDTNAELWAVEDRLREMEAEKRFEEDFIEAARSVYRLNDKRAEYKREINVALGSPLVEEKSYVN